MAYRMTISAAVIESKYLSVDAMDAAMTEKMKDPKLKLWGYSSIAKQYSYTWFDEEDMKGKIAVLVKAPKDELVHRVAIINEMNGNIPYEVETGLTDSDFMHDTMTAILIYNRPSNIIII